MGDVAVLTAASWAVAGLVSVPTLTFAAECAAALTGAAASRERQEDAQDAPAFAVLIPAHDEAGGIATTLHAVVAQLRPEDRVLVVADNCRDATAQVAQRAGVEVYVRDDAAHRGKGFALAAGRQVLGRAPPPVVIVLDADCVPEPGALRAIALVAHRDGAAVQGLYLLSDAPRADARTRLSTFAFLVKNRVRQRGLARLGGPALLQGTGMAFPWSVFAAASLASAAIVEDLELGLDLARGGVPVTFVEHAVFRSPSSSAAAIGAQRTRWEHGSLGSTWRYIPLLAAAIIRGRLSLTPLLLDLTVPPLALLVLTIAAATVFALVAGAITNDLAPTWWLGGLATMLAATVLAVWGRYGRAILPAATLLRVPLYILWKLPMYARLFGHRQRDWVRTGRD